MRKFNPKELYSWILVTSLHPLNQKFLSRFEVLIGVLLTINPKLFKNEPVTQEALSILYESLEDELGDQLIFFDDFEPVDQKELVPLFINGIKYYFFYNSLEYPYFQAKNIIDTFFADDNNNIITLIKNNIILSLEHQTRIINSINSINPIEIDEQEYIYIPSIDFYNQIEPELKNNRIPSQFNKLTFGCLGIHGEEKIISAILNNLFPSKIKGLYLQFESNNYYIFLPQIHIELLSILCYNLIKISRTYKDIISIMQKNFTKRLYNISNNFFFRENNIEYIFNPKVKVVFSNKYNLYSTFLVDNKLLFFHECSLKNNTSIQNEVDKKIKEIYTLNSDLKEANEIGAIFESANEPFFFEYNSIEPIHLIIYSPLTLETIKYTVEMDSHYIIEVINIMHLSMIFNDLFQKHNTKAAYEFIRFIKDNTRRKSKNIQAVAMDYLDYYYFSDFYNRFGKEPDSIFLEPHSASNYFNNNIFKELSDSVYEIVEKKFPNTFDLIESEPENVYLLIIRKNSIITWLLKLPICNIWIFPPNNREINHIESEIIFNVIKPILIKHFNKSISYLLELFDSKIPIENGIDIFFINNRLLGSNNKYYPFLVESANELDNNNPFIVKTFINRKNILKIYIILNFKKLDSLTELFSSYYNDGDRLLIERTYRLKPVDSPKFA